MFSSDRSPRLLKAAALVLLFSAVGAAIGWFVAASLPTTYRAEQVLGIVSREPADVTISANKRWAVVATSDSFKNGITAGRGFPEGSLSTLVSTPADGAPVTTLSVVADSPEEASKRLAAVSAALEGQSKRLDPRFPLVALTTASATEAKGISPALVATGAGVLTLLAGAVVAREVLRARGSHARDTDTLESDPTQTAAPQP